MMSAYSNVTSLPPFKFILTFMASMLVVKIGLQSLLHCMNIGIVLAAGQATLSAQQLREKIV